VVGKKDVAGRGRLRTESAGRRAEGVFPRGPGPRNRGRRLEM